MRCRGRGCREVRLLPPAQSTCRTLTEDDDECRAWCEMYFTLDGPDFASLLLILHSNRNFDEIAERHWAKWARQGRKMLLMIDN